MRVGGVTVGWCWDEEFYRGDRVWSRGVGGSCVIDGRLQ